MSQQAIDRMVSASGFVAANIAAAGAQTAVWEPSGRASFVVPADTVLMITRLDGGVTGGAAAAANSLCWELVLTAPGDTVARRTIRQTGIAQLMHPPVIVPESWQVVANIRNLSAAPIGVGTFWSLWAVMVPVREVYDESAPPFIPGLV